MLCCYCKTTYVRYYFNKRPANALEMDMFATIKFDELVYLIANLAKFMVANKLCFYSILRCERFLPVT